MLGVNPSGHMVKILVPGIGRPYINGQPNVIAKRINTSNVKPCKFDKYGRLLYAQEYWFCNHTKTKVSGLSPTCWQCEKILRELPKKFQDQPWLAPQYVNETSGQNAGRDDNTEEVNTAVPEIVGLTAEPVGFDCRQNASMGYFCEVKSVEYLQSQGLFEYEERFEDDEFWEPLLCPDWNGPQLPEEIKQTYLHEITDDSTDWNIEGYSERGTTS